MSKYVECKACGAQVPVDTDLAHLAAAVLCPGCGEWVQLVEDEDHQ